MIAFAIVFIYLLGTLAFGHRLNRKATKSTTVRAFFVADGALPLFAVSAMLFGDMIAGSSTTGTAGTGYSTGMAGGWAIWGSSFGCVLFSVCFSKFFFRIRPTGDHDGPRSLWAEVRQQGPLSGTCFHADSPVHHFLGTDISGQHVPQQHAGNGLSSCDGGRRCAFPGDGPVGSHGRRRNEQGPQLRHLLRHRVRVDGVPRYVGGAEHLGRSAARDLFRSLRARPFTVFAQFVGSALGFSISVTSINIGDLGQKHRRGSSKPPDRRRVERPVLLSFPSSLAFAARSRSTASSPTRFCSP